MNDFPDWLSPILVKELRQGLRSRAFTSTFILMQVVMILIILVSLTDDAKSGGGDFIFWAVTGFGFLVILPARGMAVIASEIKGQTIELLSLTQLSPFRIVMGKWIALGAQISLLLCSLLPFVALRYFTGGIDLVWEMKMLGLCYIGSLLLSGVAVGLSAVMLSPIVIGGTIFVCLLAFQIATALIGLSAFGHSGTAPIPVFALWCLVPWGILLALEVSTTKLTPVGESRRAYSRLWVLGLVVTVAILAAVYKAPLFFAFIALIIITPVLIVEMTAATPSLPSLYRAPKPLRFPRIPALAQITRWLSEPGWVPGTTFALLVLSALLFIMLPAFKSHQITTALVGIGAILLPLLGLQFFKSIKQKAVLYIGIQLLLLVASVPFIILKSQSIFAQLNPMTTFVIRFGQDRPEDLAFPATLAFVVTLAVLSVLILKAVREWPERKELRARALALPDL